MTGGKGCIANSDGELRKSGVSPLIHYTGDVNAHSLGLHNALFSHTFLVLRCPQCLIRPVAASKRWLFWPGFSAGALFIVMVWLGVDLI